MIRVLLIEEVRAIGEIVATVLRSEPDIEVVGCAGTLEEAEPLLSASNVALVNTPMHSDGSARLIRALRRLAPKVKIVVMGLARSQPAILQCIEAGVAGYVLKDSPLSELLRNIRAAYNNEALVSPPIAAALMSYVAEWVGFDPAGHLELAAPECLTRREREVLTLVQQGLSNQEIAESLVIELGTVKNHVHNILRKLKVNSRRDAVHVSRRAGLWSLAEVKSKPNGRRPGERPLYSSAIGAST
ncbi:MAG: response regulator transcription factor [Anaerolineales bacterium]|nr:response regulator transcription factor [Anaerolineales bacterium]